MIRIFDIFFSLLGLIILFPIIILLFVIIWFDNKSPIFMQKRLGRYKKPFVLIKFRTMHPETKSVATHLINKSNISKVGRFLRKSKFDEIPQLWNVLTGDMSLVGPRPCLLTQKTLIAERNKRGIFQIKPGITGLAQVSNITMIKPKILAENDLKMIKKLNLFYYFYYILKTMILVVKKSNLK
jgi:O-antigen biosynthesis protein WbqP